MVGAPGGNQWDVEGTGGTVVGLEDHNGDLGIMEGT